MTKAYSYLRFSTPEQMQGDSFRRQTSLAQEYCLKHGLTLDTDVTYHDLGISAFRGKNAETGRLGEFLEAVKAGLVVQGSFLLVESLDRVSRQAARKALRTLESICDEGITVVTLNDGKQYTREALDSDPMALIMSLLVFIRANEESVMKSRRLKAAWVGKREQAAKSGKRLTLRVPGWILVTPEGNFSLHKERTQVVRRIYKEASRGIGAHAIAEGLNTDKVPVFGDGALWHRSYILKLLDECPSVIGTYVPKVMDYVDGKKVRKPLDPIPHYFPAAVDPVLYQKVQAMRSKTASPLRGKATEVHNIFAGLVRCARCGGSMTLQNKGENSRRKLVCVSARYGAGCSYASIDYGTVEECFLQDSQRLLSFTPTTQVDYESQLLDLQEEADQVQSRIDSLTDLYERTREQTAIERIHGLQVELKDRQRSISELARLIEATTGALVAKRITALKELLAKTSLDRTQVNASMRALFSGLSINPDSFTATLGWRHGGESQFLFGFPKES